MFKKLIIDKPNSFQELSNSIKFEDICKGRKGAVLVDCRKGLVPIVRTTTNYEKPAQQFLPVHYDIMNKIGIEFNNALIEIYTDDYKKMGFHTDQALDLAEDSYICLFSCYENNSQDNNDMRKLKIKNKETNKEFEVLLEHNSAVIFSTKDNCEHVHAIINDSNKESKNRWLGLTLRLSKTFITFIDNVPYINNKILTLANDDEKKEFYKCKGKENSTIDFTYPEINYTISKSDIIVPKQ